MGQAEVADYAVGSPSLLLHWMRYARSGGKSGPHLTLQATSWNPSRRSASTPVSIIFFTKESKFCHYQPTKYTTHGRYMNVPRSCRKQIGSHCWTLFRIFSHCYNTSIGNHSPISAERERERDLCHLQLLRTQWLERIKVHTKHDVCHNVLPRTNEKTMEGTSRKEKIHIGSMTWNRRGQCGVSGTKGADLRSFELNSLTSTTK